MKRTGLTLLNLWGNKRDVLLSEQRYAAQAAELAAGVIRSWTHYLRMAPAVAKGNLQ